MASVHRTWEPGRPVSLSVQLGPLRRGSGDPTWAWASDGAVWRTTLTPEGAGLERIAVNNSAGTVSCEAWGPGGKWLLERLPDLFGAADDASGFVPPVVLRDTYRRNSGWRVTKTRRVLEALVPAILEQKVTGKEAWLGWRRLVRSFGEPAPLVDGGPENLFVMPSPDVWKSIPSWEWHRAGVDNKRSDAIVRVVSVAGRIEECAELSHAQADSRLRAISGVGVWTAAETAQRALGDPDAVSYGDYHLAGQVVLALTGQPDGTDVQMAELLAPFAGNRYRVQRLVELSGVSQERHGPRRTVPDMRHI